MLDIIHASLYDYPSYYDLVFGSDWKAEYRFLVACFDRFAGRRVRRVFEPACGTGRLLYRMAKAGYGVSGLDLNARAVDYCNRRLERHGFAPTAFVADMADFRLRKKADAAFNMIGSFRHLETERAATDHLRCMARCLRPGGLYVLGFHLTPTVGQPMEEESWSARRGSLCVNTHMWTIGRDLRRRRERMGMTCDVYMPTRAFRLADEIVFRTYTVRQFERLVARDGEFRMGPVFDFNYDIERPIELGPATEDAVFVLIRR